MRSNESLAIMNTESLSNTKKKTNIRILSLNVKGFNATNKEKVNHLINECQECEIDMAFLSKINTKWIFIMKSSINNKLKEIDRNIAILYADNIEYEMTKKH